MLPGVRPNNNKWTARISCNGKRICLGTYPTEQEASEAYKDALQMKRQGKTISTWTAKPVERPIDETQPIYDDDGRLLLLLILNQTIEDYLSPAWGCSTLDRQTAEAFLFEDGYTIPWGNDEITLDEILEIFNVDVDRFLKQILEAKRTGVKRIGPVLRIAKTENEDNQ